MRLLQSVLDTGPDMLAFLSDAGGPEFTVLPEFPDYHPELDGGSNGGRALEPVLYSMGGLGDLATAVRPEPSPSLPPEGALRILVHSPQFS